MAAFVIFVCAVSFLLMAPLSATLKIHLEAMLKIVIIDNEGLVLI